MYRRYRWPFAFLLLATIVSLPAQQPTQQSTKPNTQPASVGVIQVPVLALTTDLKPLPPIPLKNFRISLDGGPAFLPTAMRREGNEPLNIAILLDDSGSESALLKNFADAFAALAPKVLHPQDHFSVAAVDCTVVSTPPNLPATAQAMHAAVVTTLAFPTLHGKHSHPSCAAELPLWDAAARVIKELSTLPGRRVLLIVSSGVDGHSRVRWSPLSRFANHYNVSIFGLNDFFNFEPSSDIMLQYTRNGMDSSVHLTGGPVEPYKALCENNGGAIFAIEPKHLPQFLSSFIQMLRSRYILSFPAGLKSDFRAIAVTITNKHDDFIRTAGVTRPPTVTNGTRRRLFPSK